jgi:hypothetical protein
MLKRYFLRLLYQSRECEPPLTQRRINPTQYMSSGILSEDAPDFVEVGQAGIARDDAMRHQRRVQLVGRRTWTDELQAQL